mmetsp:Transcript_91765/g.163326  ORF Transcript_91765/g.163326 Transcript_91765/m.163326 type:complete len:183 (+) Transcript_91765:68-616(+)
MSKKQRRTTWALSALLLLALHHCSPEAFIVVTKSLDRQPGRREAAGAVIAAFSAPEPASARTSKEQILDAEKLVGQILEEECWEDYKCDGDQIRRYLGTVGVKSPLFKFEQALKEEYSDSTPDEVPDPEDVLKSIREADYQAYSTIFSMGSGGIDPKPIWADCQRDIRKLKKQLEAWKNYLK